MVPIAILIGLVIAAAGLIASWRIMQKQQNKELDKTMSPTTAKHQIMANPGLIAYVLLPIAIVIGAVLFMYFNS